MSRQLDLLPAGEVTVNILLGLSDFILQIANGATDVDVTPGFNLPDLLELVVETLQGLLKFKKHHKLLIVKPKKGYEDFRPIQR